MRLPSLTGLRPFTPSGHGQTGVTREDPAGESSEPPVGLGARIKRAVFAREVDLNVSGVHYTVERPIRTSPEPPKVEAPADELSRLQALSEQAEGLLQRLPVKMSSLWERPARTTLNTYATSAVPWLKPQSLQEVATVPLSPTPPGAALPGPQTYADRGAALLHRLRRGGALRAAQEPAVCLPGQQTGSSGAALPQETTGVQASASTAPPFHASAFGLQPVAARAQAQQILADKHRFVLARLDDMRRELRDLSSPEVQNQQRLLESRTRLGAPRASNPDLSAVQQASSERSPSHRSLPDAAAKPLLYERLQHTALEVQAQHPRCFKAEEASQQFGRALLKAVRGRPHTASTDAVPSIGVMEIASDLIARVCDGDAARAQCLLEALQERPTRRWMEGVHDLPDGAVGTEPTAVESDMRRLLRLASVVPRGAEVVHLLGPPADPVPDGDTLQAMRCFWSADAAQQVESDASVRGWLAGAKQVARCHLGGQEIDSLPEASKAAYNAVRNGYLSNAAGSPLARHDERMRKAIDAWIVREQPSVSSVSRALRGLTPHQNKSPFTAAGLKRATAVAESFGMTTSRSLADKDVREMAGGLADWARTELARDLVAAGVEPREAQAFAAATLALAERAQRPGHASQWRFGSHEAGAVRAAAFEYQHRTAAHAPQRFRQWNHHHPLPQLFEELSAQKADSFEALGAVSDYLKRQFADAAPSERRQALAQDVSVHRAADIARQQRFRSKEDLLGYFEPILLGMQLRDKLKLSGGGVVGGGLPWLPYSVPSPVVSPVLSFGLSRQEEAFFQVFMPILGMEISLGSIRSTGIEAKIGVAAGPHLPGVARVQVSATERLSRQSTGSEGTILRLFREHGRDDARDDTLRTEMLGVLDSWVRWDQVHPEGQPDYSGPLEAVLARHPKVSLGEIDAHSLTRSFVTKVSAGAMLQLHSVDGTTSRLGISVGASVKAERIAESRTEHGGHIRVKADTGDTARQKVALGLQVSALLAADPSGGEALWHAGENGAIKRGGVPGQLELSRDLYRNIEKHSVSPFTIGGKQDADLDRHYSTAEDMLAEIRRYREDWLARCVETLEPDAQGNKDTPANRNAAEAMLRSFEARVAELGRNSRLCEYNVNYTMRPQASAWIDTFRALEGLATLRGDAQAAAEAHSACDAILQQDSTWRPLILIVREKGRDVRTLGWNLVLRLQRSIGVEGQRTAAQFPPS